MPGAKRHATGSARGLVFGIVFLDIVGFSVLFPLFPAMLDHYLGLEGPDSLVGRLAAQLQDLAGGDRHAVVTLFGGLLGSLYSILQFVFTPIWGGVSDRIGRRPTLLVTLLGTCAAALLWVFSGSFALLIGARLVGGMMAGNISTATAVVADTTEGRERAAGMGFVGMAIGLGFILGPVLGGLSSQLVIGAPGPGETWSSGFALNPFSTAALVSLALALLNLTWVARSLPETLPPERRDARPPGRAWNPLAQLVRVGVPGVALTSMVYFLFLVAFSAMEFTLTFLAVERFAFTPRDNTWMFVFVGLVIAFVQGGLVRRLAPRLGERRLALLGLVLLVPSFVIIALAEGVPLLYVGLFGMAVGSALAMPSLSALASRYAPADRQGLVMGHVRSAGALSRAIGPILGGVLYWQLGSAAPYWAGGAFLLLPILLALRLPPVPEEGPAT